MERGQNGRDDFFGLRDPFAGFGGFGRQRSLISSVFGGRDPFDDPFFTNPFGRPMGGMFGPGFFGPIGGPFGDSSGFLEQAPPPRSSTRPVIRELNEEEMEDVSHNEGSHSESFVQEPDDVNEGMQSGHVQHQREFNVANARQSQPHTFTFQSSSVTYGGVNGAYYTSSRTRRSGGDGITVEESKEADTTTREATHRLSRGIHDKGHSVTRRLNSEGGVETTQTLHNINEDELAGFEESWKGNAGQHWPGWNPNVDMPNSGNIGNNTRGTNRQDQHQARAWALPGVEEARDSRRAGPRKSRIIPIS